MYSEHERVVFVVNTFIVSSLAEFVSRKHLEIPDFVRFVFKV